MMRSIFRRQNLSTGSVGAAAFLFLFIALITLLAQRADADGFSGLQGKKLTLSTDLNSAAESLLGSLLGDRQKLDGRITDLTVEEDAADRLVLAVTYTGYNGATLFGKVQNDRRREQRDVVGEAVELDGSGSARLVLHLREGLAEGTTFESRFVRLTVSAYGRSEAGLQLVYGLGKRWEVAVQPENVVVSVVARPVGKAATLRPDQQRLEVTNLPEQMKISRATFQTANPTTGQNITRVNPQLTSQYRLTNPSAKVAAKPPTARVSPPAATLQYQAINPVALALPDRVALTEASKFRYGLKQEDQARGAQGPSAVRIDLLEGILSDVDLPFEAILSLKSEVFQDKNPASGIYYYLPRAFHLEWDADDGYGMRMLYAASAEAGQAGDVLMATRLASGITTGEATLARKLLDAYRARTGSIQVQELRPLPLANPPEISLSGGLAHQYDIPAERIAVNAISDALGEVDVSWVTDPVTKQNLQLALTEDVGINGVVSFTPYGGDLGPVGITVQVKLADPVTFGQLRWSRSDEWRNRVPYPIRLKYLHALLLNGNRPVIYSWDLGGAEVAPGAKVSFDAQRVPRWLEQQSERLWVDYSVVRDCRECDAKIIADITSGVSDAAPSQITFRTLTALADTGAIELAVRVRSRYFHPRDRETEIKPLLVLGEDMAEYTTGPVYLVDRQPGEAVPGDPLFEYQLELLMADGQSHRSTRWVASNDLRVNIGRFQVEESLGFLPGAEEQP